jgi:hypothetical protein
MDVVTAETVERFETVGGVAFSGGDQPPPELEGDRGWNQFLMGPTRAELKGHWDEIDTAVKEGPQAFLVGRRDEGARFKPHYHPVNQFQVMLTGTGRIKLEPLYPGSFHYADANTPYGPIVTGPDGFEFMTVREQLTNTRIRLPEGREGINRSGRNIVRHVQPRWTNADAPDAPGVDEELVVPREPDGLEVLAVHVRRASTYVDDDTTRRCRQYVLVLSGSVEHQGGSLGKASMVFAEPGESFGAVTGECEASTVLIMRFPTWTGPGVNAV